MDKILVLNVLDLLDEYAPMSLKESYDNVGLLVGDKCDIVKRVLVGLELTDSFIEEAIEGGYNLIIVHHPLIFKPLSRVNAEDPISARVMKLIRANINLIAMHTNLDRTLGGLNDYMCEILDIKVNYPLENALDEEIPVYRIGHMETQSLKELVLRVKETLALEYIHFVGNQDKEITTVAVCTGSGMSFYKEIVAHKVDVYITGDVKYHEAMAALDSGVALIDATHYGTEIVVGKLLCRILNTKFEHRLEIDMYGQVLNPIQSL